MCERIAEFVVECTVDGDWLYPTDGGAVKRRYADEIVRCRDCKYFDTRKCKSQWPFNLDGFCSWGRRADA